MTKKHGILYEVHFLTDKLFLADKVVFFQVCTYFFPSPPSASENELGSVLEIVSRGRFFCAAIGRSASLLAFPEPVPDKEVNEWIPT